MGAWMGWDVCAGSMSQAQTAQTTATGPLPSTQTTDRDVHINLFYIQYASGKHRPLCALFPFALFFFPPKATPEDAAQARRVEQSPLPHSAVPSLVLPAKTVSSRDWLQLRKKQNWSEDPGRASLGGLAQSKKREERVPECAQYVVPMGSSRADGASAWSSSTCASLLLTRGGGSGSSKTKQNLLHHQHPSISLPLALPMPCHALCCLPMQTGFLAHRKSTHHRHIGLIVPHENIESACGWERSQTGQN